MTLYELYFNQFSFYKELDFILYKCFKEKKIKQEILDYDLNEYPLLIKIINNIIYKIYNEVEICGEEQDNLLRALFTDFENRRNIWIENLSQELFKKEESKYDRLFCDLIYKLIGNNLKERITNYEDFYNHPFFSQYNY